MKPLILASSSSSRIHMLASAGVDFKAIPARIDEAAIKQSLLSEDISPRDISDQLATAKAHQISFKNSPELYILGSDQVLEHKGVLYDKPISLSQAADHLRRLRGSAHTLFSAAVLYHEHKPVWRFIGKAQLIMRNFSDEFLDDYIASVGDDITDSVGGYKIEEKGPQLFDHIQGDYFTILGLPLLQVLAALRTHGIILQ